MKINEFKKLEKKITGYNFNQSYKSINMIMTALSYFGHVASIFLAFFFMSKIISGAMSDNPVAVFISSIIILAGLELLKRDIFDKFSIQSLKDKGISKAVTPLLLTSLLLIFFSFYSTINGAKQFSSKSKEIETTTKNEIKVYKDSISTVYQVKIDVLENQNIDLFEANKKLDDEARELPANLSTAKNRIRQRIDVNNAQIEKNVGLINNIKSERDKDIKEYESNLLTESNSNKEENSKNSFLFVIISTLIELIILGGVYFNEYYKFRSYREFRDKLEKDPNYQKWLLYDQILSILITDETKMNQKLLSNKAIIDMCKVNDIIVLPKDLTDFMKVVSGLGIIKVSGSVKYIAKTKEIADQSLRKHFNIV
jgi:cell division protein FtsB